MRKYSSPLEAPTKSSIINLKDGRVIFTESNGFKFFITSTKGVVTPVSEAYWLKAKSKRVTKKWKRNQIKA